MGKGEREEEVSRERPDKSEAKEELERRKIEEKGKRGGGRRL